MPSRVILSIEANIANSHRCLHHAAYAASTLSDLGLHDDLQMIMLELERLQVDLLKGAGRRRVLIHSQDVTRTDRNSQWPHSRP